MSRSIPSRALRLVMVLCTVCVVISKTLRRHMISTDMTSNHPHLAAIKFHVHVVTYELQKRCFERVHNIVNLLVVNLYRYVYNSNLITYVRVNQQSKK